jgi:hypothetical protein
MTTSAVSVSSRSTASAEEQILLNCARQKMSPDLLEATKALLATPINWERLIQTAWRHGVAPLLQKHLSAQALESFVPNETRNELRQGYVRAAFRSQTHLVAIEELLREFETQNLSVILLKGAALCLTTYHNAALRAFADIDLLIREKDIEAAKNALTACGYTLAPVLISEELSRQFHVNLPFVKSGDRPVHVELHWRLTDRFSTYALPEEECWQRARRIAVEQTTALVLEVHDALIYLATHLDKHGYLNQAIAGHDDAARWVLDELSANRLIWFTDLHELMVGNAIDWTLIEARCDQEQLREVIGSTLILLRDLLGTEGIPATILQHKRAPLSKRFAKSMAAFAASNDRRRQFFRQHILRTRKGFELRLVRLFDLWNFAVSANDGSVGRRIAQCSALLIALSRARLRNFIRRRL